MEYHKFENSAAGLDRCQGQFKVEKHQNADGLKNIFLQIQESLK